MSDEKDPLRRQADWKRAQDARNATTASIGRDLMDAWNRDKTDPSLMAVVGHDSTFGFEFCIERDGVTYTVEIRRDLGS